MRAGVLLVFGLCSCTVRSRAEAPALAEPDHDSRLAAIVAEQRARDAEALVEHERRAAKRLERELAEAEERAAARHADETAKLRRAEAADAMWKSIDVKRCSDEGHMPTCAALADFIKGFPDHPEVPAARTALRAGTEIADARYERRQAAERDAAEAAARNAAEAQPRAKRARCCDGGLDAACGCAGGPGCCYLRGGVCGCE